MRSPTTSTSSPRRPQCCGLDRVAVLGAGDGIDVDVELGRRPASLATSRPESLDRLRLVDRVDRIADGVICRLGYRRPRPGFLVAAAIDLAAAVLATGDAGWRALTVTRAAQGNGADRVPPASSVTAADPLAAARTLLETAAEFHVAALRGAVPVFETIDADDSTTMASSTRTSSSARTIATGDLDDAGNRFVWGDITVGELIALSPSPADLAQSIWGAIHGLRVGRQGGRQMIAAPFDLDGPLPNERTLIEASAGTGKTYSIAALVTRYVAGDLAHHHDLVEGIGIDEVLVVTYTRAAAAELRDRIRAKLQVAADYLDGGALPAGDEWLRRLRRRLAACPPAAQRPPAPRPRPLRRGDDHHDSRLLPAGPGPEWPARRGRRPRRAGRERRRAGRRGRPRPPARPPRRRPAGVVPRPAGSSARPPLVRPVRRPSAPPAVARRRRAPPHRHGAGGALEPRGALRAGSLDRWARRAWATCVAEAVAEVERRQRARRQIGYDRLVSDLAGALADPRDGPQLAEPSSRRAIASSSSTSSRTPTGCSGRSSTAPSPIIG